MIKLVVFDFDGTLADTKNLLLHLISNDINSIRHKLTKKFLIDFGNRPLDDALRLLGVHEKVLKYFADKIHLDFKEHARKVNLAPNVRSLSKIKENKIILSNSLSKLIRTILSINKIRFFKEIIGADSFRNKKEAFNNLLKKRKLKDYEVLYVGDRPIDARLARKIGCLSVLVSNSISWSGRKYLLYSKPDFIINNLGDLKKIIDKLNKN